MKKNIMQKSHKICKHIKPNGERCKVNTLTDDDYCFWHSQKTQRQRKEAQRRGGESPKPKKTGIVVKEKELGLLWQSPAIVKFSDIDTEEKGEVDYAPAQTPQNVLAILEETLNLVRNKRIDVKRANCIGFLAEHCIRIQSLIHPKEGKESKESKEGGGGLASELNSSI